MKCAIMSGDSGVLLLSVLLRWPVGAPEIGGRVKLVISRILKNAGLFVRSS